MFQYDFMKNIKIKHKLWIKKRIDNGVSWTGAVKLGLFAPELKRAIKNKIEIPKIDFNKHDI